MGELSEAEVNKFKVSDLKKHLKERSLPCTGKKADLKKRLLEAMREAANTEETAPEETEPASEESKEAVAEADQSSEAEATEATEETTEVTEEASEATEETTEATEEKAEPVEEEQVDMIDIEEPAQDEDIVVYMQRLQNVATTEAMISTEETSETAAPQKRAREDDDEEEHPAKRQKTEDEEGESTPTTEDKKEEKKPITARSHTEHSLRDILFEEGDIVKYVYDEIQKSPDMLEELKTFMHTHPSLCKLFVRGLLPKHREMDLRTMYGRYGNIRDTRILYDRQTGISKNIGFIVFSNCEEALQALERPERTIDCPNGQKRTIYLNLAMKPHNLNENSRMRTSGRPRGYGRY